MEIILNSYGSYLKKEQGMFAVEHEGNKVLIPPEKVSSIIISRGAQISSDAAILAIENDIDVIFANKNGRPIGRIWSGLFGSISTIRKKQIDFAFSKAAVKWIKEIIVEKMTNQTAILLAYSDSKKENEKEINKIINKINDYKNKVKQIKGQLVSEIAPTLRGWEGGASVQYFKGLLLIIPPQYHFNGRSQHPAKDVFNAMLNYGYGILYGKVESALIRAGLDPYLGIFHREDYNRPVLVFDVIEKYRIWIDYVVMSLIMQEVVDEEWYVIEDNETCRLDTLGKRILAQSVNDYLAEIITLEGISRSRQEHILLYARKIVNKIINL